MRSILLSLAAVALAACSQLDATTAPASKANAVVKHAHGDTYADLGEVEGDTTLYGSCLLWDHCLEISLEDYYQILGTADHLKQLGVATCSQLGAALEAAVTQGRIKRGAYTIPQVIAITTGASGNLVDPFGWSIFSPNYSFAFENRGPLIHEATHMLQYAGLYGTPIWPDRGINSLYQAESEAYAMEASVNSCMQ